jgi:hypothetical protein
MLAELEDQVTGEIFDRGDRRERLGQALGLEPIEAGFLQFDQIRDIEDVGNLRERVTFALRTGVRWLLDGERSRRKRERAVHGSRRHAGIGRGTFRALRLTLTRRGALRRGLRCRRFRQ